MEKNVIMSQDRKQYIIKEIEKFEEDCSFSQFISNCSRIYELRKEFNKTEMDKMYINIAFKMMFLSAVYKFYPHDLDLKLFVSIRECTGEMFKDALSKGGNIYLTDSDLIRRYYNKDIKSKCPLQFYYYYLFISK